MQISINAARALHLTAQGLAVGPRRPATKADVLAAIRQMCMLQIDTIHVVARSPYFVLWSRLGDYPPQWLDELLAEGALFEYWSHAACFLPIEDYALYRRSMLAASPRSQAWLAENPAVAEVVLAMVRAQGTVRSSDFPRTDGKGGGWWDHKPEKHALDALFNIGTLMIARRERFQRIYALREQVLPAWDDANLPSPEHVQRTMVEKTIRALGITYARWVADYFRLAKRGIDNVIAELVDIGRIFPVQIEDASEPAYVHVSHQETAGRAAAECLPATYTTLLSPFDPVVWDRARAEELFGFTYKIETYTPAAQRRYGYFTLPILHAGALVGRLDPKAHRRDGVFEVKALHLEPTVLATPALAAALAQTLAACARWHATPQVVIRDADPPELAELLAAEVDAGA